MIFSAILSIFLISLLSIFKIGLNEPAGLFSYIWLAFIFFSIVFLQPYYHFFYSGINWILLISILFVICASFFPRLSIKEKVTSSQVDKASMPWWLLFIFTAFAFLSVVHTMSNQGVTLSPFLSFSALQETSHQSAMLRYSGEESFSLIGQILGTFIYVTPICAGYSFVYARTKKQKLLCYSSFVPPLLSMLLTSAKLAVVAYVILVFIGYYVSYLSRHQQLPRINSKLLIRIFLFLIVLLGLFYLSFVLRIGQTSTDLFKTIIDKLAIYGFGHIQSFDVWFEEFASASDYGFGINTFLAVSSKLGLADKQQGVYEFIWGSSSNVYTQFRGLIEDFGPILSLGILVILFILCYYCIVLVKKKPLAILPQVVLSATLFYLLFIFVSAWVYTSYLLAFIFFYLYLLVSKKVRLVYRRRR